MDPIDILGSLLGQKAGGKGAGADILKEIFGGARRGAQPRTEAQPRAEAPRTSPGLSENEMERQARELEDFLNVAKDRSASRPAGQPRLNPQPLPPQQPQSRQPFPQQQPQTRPSSQAAPGQQAPSQGGWVSQSPFERRFDSPQDDAAAQQNLQAMVLVQAMVNAAKCDGQISQQEQQNILSRLENPSPDAIGFLREEFARPLDVREFAWSVPVGMEQSVYSMSLIAIDVDSAKEESYLRDLARGLRLSPEICAQIKERVTGGTFRMAAAAR